MQKNEYENFKTYWKLIFNYYKPERRDLEEDSKLYFHFLSEEFTIEDVNLIVKYIIRHNKYYPTIYEFREAYFHADLEQRQLAAKARAEETVFDFEQEQIRKRKEWEALSAEEKKALEREFLESIDKLCGHVNSSEV